MKEVTLSSSPSGGRWLTPAIILLGLGLSLLVHLFMSGSSLSIPPDDWRPILDVHLHDRPFCMRPFQSYSTLALAEVTGLTHRDAFFVIQFLLMGLTAYAFYRLLGALGFSRVWGHAGLVCFFLSLPVLAAFFAPIHTWDDFWLYLFPILLSMAVLKHRWPWVSALFFLSCLARETAVFLFPVLAVMAWRDRRAVSPVILTVSLTLPLLLFYAYTSSFQGDLRVDLFGMLKHNFGNIQTTTDSVVSLLNAFGWCLPAALLGWLLLLRRDRTTEESYLFSGLLLYWPINTVASASLAMVRETRLLFPPFVFVIPLALMAAREVAPYWHGGQRLAVLTVVALTLGAAGIWFGYVLHPTFAYGTSSILRRDYAGLSIGLTAAFLIVWYLARKQKKAAPESGAA